MADAAVKPRKPKPARNRRRGLGPWLIVAALVLGFSTALSAGWLPSVEKLLFGSTAEAHDSAAAADETKPAAQAQTQPAQTAATPPVEQKADVVDTDALMAKVNSSKAQQAVQILSAMPPYKAAPILQALTADEAVAVLRQMDQVLAADILSSMDPAQAAAIGKLLLQPAAAQP